LGGDRWQRRQRERRQRKRRQRERRERERPKLKCITNIL